MRCARGDDIIRTVGRPESSVERRAAEVSPWLSSDYLSRTVVARGPTYTHTHGTMMDGISCVFVSGNE